MPEFVEFKNINQEDIIQGPTVRFPNMDNPDYCGLMRKWLEASKKYDWIKINPIDHVPEIYADHHMLSNLRMCEGLFYEEILNHTRSVYRAWFLEFGDWFHRMMEVFYEPEKEGRHISCLDFMLTGRKLWKHMDLDFHKTNGPGQKGYKEIGGSDGAIALLGQYFACYGDGKDRMRVVDTEVSFGKEREVPIIDNHTIYPLAPFRAYLTGRIDLVMDNGTKLGPVDHKTRSYFSGDEVTDYMIHDGMTGYVYTLSTIIRNRYPELAELGRTPNTLWLNHISRKPTNNPSDRFKRLPVLRTPSQLEAFRLRQISSFIKLYELVILGRSPDWNTSVCTMMWYHDCPMKALHEQAPETQQMVKNHYVQVVPWNPYREDFNDKVIGAKQVGEVTKDIIVEK